MNILFIGDIFAHAGRSLVAAQFSRLMSVLRVDLAIANSENSAGGFGVTPQVATELLDLGVDVLTGGNHSWDKREIYEYMGREPRLLRPANYPEGCPGSGLYVAKARNGVQCAVINLQGRTYMPATECPFRKVDTLLSELNSDIKVRFVDFHAEVTSEKISMGWHLDGRVTAMVGTHTHVPTADGRVLPNGTAYQTDVGMTGPYDSVIGVEKDAVLKKFRTAMPGKLEPAKGRVELHSVLVEVDEASGRARSIRRCKATHQQIELEGAGQIL
jgi:metallophosphoesterase (TIGR00282 family)